MGHPYEQGFDLRLVPEKLFEPLSWKTPKTIFVNSNRKRGRLGPLAGADLRLALYKHGLWYQNRQKLDRNMAFRDEKLGKWTLFPARFSSG
jgi:hypothetical protein